MQMPILTYPHFSQFLQLQQQQLHQHYVRVSSEPPASSEASTESSSPSPSPPLSAPDHKAIPSKSFTIDAILGLREEAVRDNLYHPAFHPRLHVPDLSRLSGVLSSRDSASTYSSSRPPDKNPCETNKKCSGKSKRVRTIFTPEQLERLEAEFERQQYMVGPERLYLAHTLQLTEAQVKVWFQNRRIKWRKQHLELQQQRLAVMKQRQRVEPDDSADSDDSCTGVGGGGGAGTGSGKFGFPSTEGTTDTQPGHFSSSYQHEGNLSSRESLTNHCEEDFV